MTGFKRNKTIERLKVGLIVLLAMSALLLGRQTGLFNDFFSAIPLFGNVAELIRGTGPTMPDNGETILMEAARPITIVITNEVGERYGAKYDSSARNAAYDRTSSIMREALGSASTPSEISEDIWRIALMEPGVYFEYMMPVTLSILDGWLGARLPDVSRNIPIRRVFVAFGEDRSRVCYQDSENGLFFAADTASSTGKVQELDVFTPNGAQFAFETGITAAQTAPYMIILQGNEHQEIRAGAVGSAGDLLDIVMSAMGHSNEMVMPYYDPDGVLVRVGTQFNTHADPLGRVMYRRTDLLQTGGGSAHWPSDGEIIEMARAVVADTIGDSYNGGEVFFESLEYGMGSFRTVLFGYYIAGGRVALFEDGYAAKITFAGGTISEMELVFRSYSLTGEYARLPPEKLALAAAGGEFILSYSDTGAERLHPTWTQR